MVARGACMVLFGWGVCGFIRGACMVFPGAHAWFYSGGVHGFIWGACMVLFGGACVVLFGGHAWFFWGEGAMRGFFSFFGYNEIRSILLECILVIVAVVIGQRG